MKKTETKKIIEAMWRLSEDVESIDGVANTAIAQAAQRLQELHDGMHDAINHCKGVVPRSCEYLYDQDYYDGVSK